MAVESATLDIDKTTISNLDSNQTDVTVPTADTDGANDSKETSYINTNWQQQYGYYTKIPDVKAAIDTRAIWTVGKKWVAPDVGTTVILDHVSGWGEDSFQTILQNLVTVKRIGGDAFAEIMRDKNGELLNLKPLNPGNIKIVTNKKGILIRYEQVNKGKNTIFQPKDIFHLMNKRVADQIHGTSDIDVLEPIILASNESFVDVKKVQHRYVKPMMKWELDTDDQTQIDAFITKTEEAKEKGEDIYIPKDTVSHELVTVPSSATLSPYQWQENLNAKFYQVVGIPQIILGNAAEFSESSAKIAYLSFQQSVEAEQLDIETAAWKQLKVRFKLTFPATIQNELISDTSKDGKLGATNLQPNDATLTQGQQEGAQ